MDGKPEDIPQDVWDDALKCSCILSAQFDRHVEGIARAIMAERNRWQPAVTYFMRYCQDEADDAENCVCGNEQHEDAKAFAAAIPSPAPKE